MSRAALRIFAGCSGGPGGEADAPTERERERADRPFWLMLAPCVLLLAVALAGVPAGGPHAAAALATLVSDPRMVVLPPSSRDVPWDALTTVGLAIALVIVSLIRRRPVRRAARTISAAEEAPFAGLQFLHSGLIGDYVSWTALGLAALATWFGLAAG